MTKFKFIDLIDKIFINICLFFLFYAWINFYLRDLWLSFIFASIISISATTIFFYIYNKKTNKKQLSKNQLLDIEKTYLTFKLMNENERFNILKNIISCERIKTVGNVIEICENDEMRALILATKYEKLTQLEIENHLSEFDFQRYKKISFICDSSEDVNLNFLNNIKIEIIDKNKLFSMIKLKNISLNSEFLAKNAKNKKTFYEILRLFFNPQKSKSFFFCGFILLFSSIILPYHLYYLIFGSLLIVFSMVCKLTCLI